MAGAEPAGGEKFANILGQRQEAQGVGDIRAALVERLKTEKLKAASAQVAEALGVSKRDVYQMGLRIQQGN